MGKSSGLYRNTSSARILPWFSLNGNVAPMRKILLSFPLILFLLSSCNHRPPGFEILGPDQFVIDSHKIREGKLSILEMQGAPIAEFPETAMEEYEDVIANGDILHVTLHHPTRNDIVSSINAINASVGFHITHDHISLPDLPSIKVAGLTLDQARKKVEQKYLDQIQDVEIFLGYKNRLARKVDLLGMVNTPAIPVDGKIRLYDTLAFAKVPNRANLFMSYVVREGKALPIDLSKLIKGGDLSHNIVMRGGDKIYIADPDDAKVMLMGEVGFPQALPLPSGSISLREALVSAGGIPYTGDKRSIQVIRGNIRQPKVYVLNWNLIINLPNDSLLLMPGDTVYVSAKPITEWNRFISQLTPSFQGIQGSVATSRVVGLK